MRVAWILFLILLGAGCTDFSGPGGGGRSTECSPGAPRNCTRILSVRGPAFYGGPAFSVVADSSAVQLEVYEELVGPCTDIFDGTPATCHWPVSATVSWSSSNPSAATVDANGLMHTGMAGSVTITATDRANSVEGTTTFQVIHVTTVTLDPARISLVRGDTSFVTAIATDSTSGATAGTIPIRWRSSNPEVAVVDSASVFPPRDGVGLIDAVAAGTATITATAPDGVSGQVTVTVTETGALTFESISPGADYTCGIATATSKAFCWGFNANGNLGNPSVSGDTALPVAVSGTSTYSTVSAGNRTTCALATGGAAWCWGLNNEGEVGDGSAAERDAPTRVAGGWTYTGLAVGVYHACAVRSDGAAVCWGESDAGAVGATTSDTCPGQGTAIPCTMSPVLVSGGLHVTSITAGISHSCAITDTGIAECWGNNASGQLGAATSATCATYYFGTVPCSRSPLPVSSSVRFTSIQAGGNETCALATDGKAYCWGANDIGQLGVSDTAAVVSVPEPVAGGLTFIAIAVSGQTICALTASGDAYCWGGWAPGPGTPTPVPGGIAFRAIGTGWNHACALTAPGAGYCWGRAGFTPVPIPDPQ
jgi:alpha-tubulin suppressor-like RCC1 family protein